MDTHETWRRQLSRDPDGSKEPEGPEAIEGPRVRYLHIVARTRLDLLLTLRRRFRDDASVHVMLDRREGNRRRQSRPVAFVADRRHTQDRRGPREYWEDIAYHPAVIIPVDPLRHREPTMALPVRDTPTQEREDPIDPEQIPERLLAWIEESRHIVERVVPAIVRERDEACARLEQSTRRCLDLQAESDALRAEVARLTAANSQSEREHADVARRLGPVLAEIGGALESLRELQHRHHSSPADTDPSSPPGAGASSAGE